MARASGAYVSGVVRFIVLVLALACGRTGLAHQAQTSFVDVTCTADRLNLRVTLDPHVTPLAARIDRDGDGVMAPVEIETAQKSLREFILGRVVGRGNGGVCETDGEPHDQYLVELGMWQLEQTYRCHDACAQTTLALSFIDTLPREHRVVVRQNDGTRFVTHTLQRPDVLVPRLEHLVWGDRFDLVKLGVEHILTGWDHLAFVAGLVLAAAGLRWALLVLTAFTVAHSVTLFLTALGWVSLPSRLIESTIALSIAIVAGLNLRGQARHTRTGASLAFGFGLIHGMGFASALGSVFDGADLVPSLLGFNLGVELGQAVVVVLLWPIVRKMAQPSRRVANILLILLSSWWMIERLFG